MVEFCGIYPFPIFVILLQCVPRKLSSHFHVEASHEALLEAIDFLLSWHKVKKFRILLRSSKLIQKSQLLQKIL